LFRCHPFYRFTPVLGIQGNKPELFTYYIPFPIEVLDLAKDRIYCPDNIIRIMFVGKFGQERKKHIFLLDVLESLNCSNIEVSFFGVSSDYHLSDKKYHSEFLRRCKVSSLKISIMESVKYKDMLESYLNHDLLICPSIREPFGISVLEALASGCPAIVSNDSGSAGYVENSVNGFVFKANNFNELRNHVEFFINNPGKIREYGVNAIEKIRKEHSLQDFAKKIVKYGCK
jgi:glycosyltransferase involved in cell wall biosynthesis